MGNQTENLVQAIFGESASIFIDFPLLVASADSILSVELSRQEGKGSDLSPREQRILCLRFGLDRGKGRTLEEVGNVFNVSKDRIRQIEARALRKLRHPSHSRNLRAILYHPTREDQRAIVMRRRLCDELLKFYPDAPAYSLVMGIKRPYLKKALRDLTTGNIAEQVRHSCGLSMRFCRNCGTVTLPNWDFCSKECQRGYQILTLCCDQCGVTFKRKASLTLYRLSEQGLKHYYCSKHCAGVAIGKRNRGHTKKYF